ncbi:hypothetical protein AVDCRST_MAG84-2742 [uncultured Microcoleus sp.]|uniref:Uncharacterized protein n=1 Tax=uncultured Microcoleus sp. TaxID=259945 RepID=A0A6J4M7U5_9CYAN|nr:hypothetical protein AVDCRST_MAG84-2742 [uncultured Microcoleus sp.]
MTDAETGFFTKIFRYSHRFQLKNPVSLVFVRKCSSCISSNS